MFGWGLLFAVFAAILFAPGAALAQSKTCGPGAEEISRSIVNGTTTLRCHCADGFKPHAGRCEAGVVDLNLLAKENSDRVISGLNSLAKELGWNADKRAHLNKALNDLKFDGDPDATKAQIQSTWRDIVARVQDDRLVHEASKGGGLGFPGAGKQDHEDCTVFALANATGRPYGFIAASASKLISESHWRSSDERNHPQTVIEEHGLKGGEVVMLAEVFGRAQVAPAARFSEILRDGHPIMINVVPQNGDFESGHEVVLTKTFQHGGETWFVMMDSNQGPQQRRFLSKKELFTILQENGVVYSASAHRTPRLLRSGGL